ncbi:MAG: DHH family phosphoesterase [Clostridia bacterium]|nr:DHH family phosphoesterase [Clostridia bacterium]
MKTINNSNTIEEIVSALKAIKKCVIFSHFNPDGDAIGSAMALTLALENAGKKVDTYIKFDAGQETLPWKFLYLPHIQKVKNLNDTKSSLCLMRTAVKEVDIDFGNYDTLVAIDIASVDRIGDCYKKFLKFPGTTINIDHHDSDKGFAKYNIITEEPATCQMLPEIFDLCGFEITKDIAEYLACGMLTDTGNLSHNDVTVESYKIMARLKEIGADIYRDNYELLVKQPVERARLYGRVVSGGIYTNLCEEDVTIDGGVKPLIGIVVTRLKDLEECGAKQEHTSGIVDFPLSVEGVVVAVSVMEQEGKDGKGNYFRLSFRSRCGYDVNEVAQAEFNGGGHAAAAGGRLYGGIEEVIDRIEKGLRRHSYDWIRKYKQARGETFH